MRFILVEKLLNEEIKTDDAVEVLKDDSSSPEDKINASLMILTANGASNSSAYHIIEDKKDTSGILIDAITSSADKGVMKEFVSILSKLDCNSLKPFQCSNLLVLLNLVDTAGIKLSGAGQEKYLTKTSLYTRDTIEFEYSVRVCDVFCDNSKLSKYFPTDKVDNIKIDNLFIGNNLKDAGNRDKDTTTNTIHGTVHVLSGKGPKEGPDKKSSNGSKEQSQHPTYKSEEAANADGANEKDNIIHIDGDFVFDGKDWKPVEV